MMSFVSNPQYTLILFNMVPIKHVPSSTEQSIGNCVGVLILCLTKNVSQETLYYRFDKWWIAICCVSEFRYLESWIMCYLSLWLIHVLFYSIVYTRLHFVILWNRHNQLYPLPFRFSFICTGWEILMRN